MLCPCWQPPAAGSDSKKTVGKLPRLWNPRLWPWIDDLFQGLKLHNHQICNSCGLKQGDLPDLKGTHNDKHYEYTKRNRVMWRSPCSDIPTLGIVYKNVYIYDAWICMAIVLWFSTTLPNNGHMRQHAFPSFPLLFAEKQLSVTNACSWRCALAAIGRSVVDVITSNKE